MISLSKICLLIAVSLAMKTAISCSGWVCVSDDKTIKYTETLSQVPQSLENFTQCLVTIDRSITSNQVNNYFFLVKSKDIKLNNKFVATSISAQNDANDDKKNESAYSLNLSGIRISTDGISRVGVAKGVLRLTIPSLDNTTLTLKPMAVTCEFSR